MSPSSTTVAKTYNATATSYKSHWNPTDARQTHVTAPERRARQQNAQAIVNDYYDLTTTAIELFWSRHFHFSRFPLKSTTMREGFAAHESFLALMMALRPGMRVLDAGCGIGGPARALARLVRCEIVGLNNNAAQIVRARQLTREEGVEDLVSYVQGDFMAMPFADGAFDAVYAIEATCHAPDKSVYAECWRVLKPGGVFGVYEWAMTDRFDEGDAEHVGIRNRIERGNGVTNLAGLDECRRALVDAGFAIEYEEDLAERSGDAMPWFWPFAGEFGRATCWEDLWKVWRLNKRVRRVVWYYVRVLQVLRLAPVGATEALTTLAFGVDGCADGGKMGIFTPMAMFVGRKSAAA